MEIEDNVSSDPEDVVRRVDKQAKEEHVVRWVNQYVYVMYPVGRNDLEAQETLAELLDEFLSLCESWGMKEYAIKRMTEKTHKKTRKPRPKAGS